MTTDRANYLPHMAVINVIVPTCCEACYTRVLICGTATPSDDIVSDAPEGTRFIGTDIRLGDEGYMLELNCHPLLAHYGPFHSHSPRVQSTNEIL